jgi:hypothetical protein
MVYVAQAIKSLIVQMIVVINHVAAKIAQKVKWLLLLSALFYQQPFVAL